MSVQPLTLLRIQGPHPYLSDVEHWYTRSFPANERREFRQVSSMLGLPDMHLCVLLNAEQPIGFMIYWLLPDCLFVEHLVVAPALRGNGFGQRTMDRMCAMTRKVVVLEVELPDDADSQSRIRFYERLGFIISPFPYAQPPYRLNDVSIPMHLMTWPEFTDEAFYRQVVAQIRTNVYEKFW